MKKKIIKRLPFTKKLRQVLVFTSIILFGILDSKNVYAQDQSGSNNPLHGTIKGKILDATNKPIPMALIKLFANSDTSYLKPLNLASADAQGIYSLNPISAGLYRITISFTGFKTIYISNINVQENKVSDQGTTIMGESTNNLKEIKVTSKKPFIERKVDKTVLNVESDILANGENIIEVLKKAPGVTVDKDDHISLNGKQGVTLMLDGKLTYLSIEALTNLLKNTQATSVEQIEIITQPSAKYDAAGNTGIINIKTKKLKKLGLNGIVTTGFGHGIYPKLNESINLNFKTGQFNIYGNYYYGWNKNQQYLTIIRSFLTLGNESVYNQNSMILNDYQNHDFKSGIDYSIDKNQTLGFQFNGYSYHGNSPTSNLTHIQNIQGVLDSTLLSSTSNFNRGRGFTYDANYKNTLDSLGQELNVDLAYSNYNNFSSTQLSNSFYQPNSNRSSSNNAIQNLSPSLGNIRVGKIDYTLPINKSSKLDLGIKYSWVNTNNTLTYDSLIKGIYVLALTQSNQFNYLEKVGAAYGSLSHQWKHTSIVVGLRVENTHSTGDLLTTNNVVTNKYINFFPNVSFSQKIDSNNQFGFSYSRRIDRPSYQDLNPFRFYLDQFTYQIGNPFLKPQFTESFEISNTYKQSTFISFNFSWTKDVETQVIIADPITHIVSQTNANLANLYSYSLTFSRPFNPTSWWNINLNLNGNFNRYTAPSIDSNAILLKSKLSGSANITNTLTLPNNFTVELSGYYNAPALYGYFETKSQHAISLGFQKSLWRKKANLKLNINDIFNTNRFVATEKYSNVNIYVNNTFDSRRASLSFTYNFGTNPHRNEKSTAADQEQSRVKTH